MINAHPVLPEIGVYQPRIHQDTRGSFAEWFKAAELEEFTGYPLDVQQANISHSKAGVVRGLHFAAVPPGQAKYVTCMAGRVIDVVMDVRRGSPTFGKIAFQELSAAAQTGIFVPVGFAHGFLALEDSAVCYLTSEGYNPDAEFELSPLAIDWPETPWPVDAAAPLIYSEKDAAAPALSESENLPDYEECQAYENMMRDAWAIANETAGNED